ncbi:hypothetical protein ES705_20022 [subsurface metagenome]
MEIKFYDKDPEKDGKEISMWKFFKRSGLIPKLSDLLKKNNTSPFR